MEALRPGDPGIVGRYRLSARLGQGALGTVFLGRADGGRAAVKLVRPDLVHDEKFRERFRRECARARRVSGPHVAALLDADADGAPPWLATEYVCGPSLEEVVASFGPLPEDAVRGLALALARALLPGRESGVAHGTVKPGNVLLSADGAQLTDFAVGRALAAASVASTGAAGTPGLPAPEQVTGGSVGPEADVFAYAGVLCHALGVRPFGRGAAGDLAQRVVREAPDLSGMPDGLLELVRDCMVKRPSARPTPQDLLDRLGDEDALWLPRQVRAEIARYESEAVPKPEKTDVAPAARASAAAAREAARAPRPSAAGPVGAGSAAAEADLTVALPDRPAGPAASKPAAQRSTPVPEGQRPAGAGSAGRGQTPDSRSAVPGPVLDPTRRAFPSAPPARSGRPDQAGRPGQSLPQQGGDRAAFSGIPAAPEVTGPGGGSARGTSTGPTSNPTVWYGVIALLGLTAAVLGGWRLFDGGWRDAQNTVIGTVLPVLALVCGLAGLAVLANAVRTARGAGQRDGGARLE